MKTQLNELMKIKISKKIQPLHKPRVHGLVVIVKVNPAPDPLHRVLPFGGVLHHNGSTFEKNG
jgi:hypothetical protein